MKLRNIYLLLAGLLLSESVGAMDSDVETSAASSSAVPVSSPIPVSEDFQPAESHTYELVNVGGYTLRKDLCSGRLLVRLNEVSMARNASNCHTYWAVQSSLPDNKFPITVSKVYNDFFHLTYNGTQYLTETQINLPDKLVNVFGRKGCLKLVCENGQEILVDSDGIHYLTSDQ